ncbi:hypothetical protein ACTFIT_004411 [Dictyostelium discoideum]
MPTKRARYPMSEGKWDIWNIDQRQSTQKLLEINQFMHDSLTKSIKRAIYTQILTPIKNNNNQPLSQTDWYDEIHKQHANIPKIGFQWTLNLRGYHSYGQIFKNILLIKDPKTKDTCLSLNYLYNKYCTLCNENLGNDPYGHLFFNCKKTPEFLESSKLKTSYSLNEVEIPPNMKKDHEDKINYSNLDSTKNTLNGDMNVLIMSYSKPLKK